MKLRIAFTFTLVIFLFNSLYPQPTVNSITLPDKNGGMPFGIYSCQYSPINNTLYLGGAYFIFAIDGVTDQTIARIPISGAASKMLWIPGENKIISAGSKFITIINCASNTVSKTINVDDGGNFPDCLEYNPVNKRVYTSYFDSLDIYVIDIVRDSIITKIHTPERFSKIAWNASDSLLWWAKGNRIRRYNCSTNTLKDSMWINDVELSEIECNTTSHKMYFSDGYGRILIKDTSSITFCNVGITPSGLIWNAANNKLYCGGNGKIIVIDGVTNNVIKTISLSSSPVKLFWNSSSNKVYSINYYDGYTYYMTVINGLTDSVITTLPLTNASNDPLKIDLCANNLNNKVYYPVNVYNRLMIINDINNIVLKEITLGANSYSLAWNTAYNKLFSIIYSTSFNPEDGSLPGYVSIIDGTSLLLEATIQVGNNPLGIAQNTIYNTIYCVNAGSNNISVIDAGTNQVSNTIPVGGRPKSILWNPAVNKIYTANSDSGTVTVINGASNTRLATVTTGTNPSVLALNSTNNKIYCGFLLKDSIAVIDGFTNMTTKKIKTGNAAAILLWNSAGNKIYSSQKWNNGGVSIIDGVTDTLIISYPIPWISNVTCNTTNNKVYCGSQTEGVIIIDGSTNQITDTLQFGYSIKTGPVYWHSIDNQLYCYCYDNITYNGWLYVVDGASDSLVTVIPLGRSYYPSFYGTPFASDIQRGRIFLGDAYSRILVIDPHPTGLISEKDKKVPGKFLLEQNYPNPFNPSTSIKFEIPRECIVTLKIFNMLGEEVSQLYSGKPGIGVHTINWDAGNYSSGVYIYRLKAGDFIQSKKMMLIK